MKSVPSQLLAATLSFTIAIASYAYTLDASGYRLSGTQLSGQTVSYAYDNLYRLTNETIAADPSSVNGTVNYTYAAVGNPTQKVSTLPGYFDAFCKCTPINSGRRLQQSSTAQIIMVHDRRTHWIRRCLGENLSLCDDYD